MQELYPLTAGFALGLLFFARRDWTPGPVFRAVLIGFVALSATFLSGEWLRGWGFVALDLVEVGLLACAGLLAARRMDRRPRRRQG